MSTLKNRIANNTRYNILANQFVFAPKSITNRAMITYIFAMLGCVVLYSANILSLQWWIFGLISVLGFFAFANRQTKLWINIRSVTFTKKLFWSAFAIRVIWVFVSYYLHYQWTDTPFSINAADELWYDETAHYAANMLREGDWHLYTNVRDYSGYAFSDSGYPMYLSILYWIFQDSILMVRIVKAALSAWTALLIYKAASRNLGETTGRMAGIFCMLMPNLIYYCCFQLKEIEMVFLATLFVERADWLLRQPKLKFFPTMAVMLIPVLLFTIRTALAATLIAAFFCALLLTTGRVSGYGKRFVLVIAAGAFALIMFFSSTSIGNDIKDMWQRGGSGQKANMEWRSRRSGAISQQFAKYAGAAVFAPMIFTIPFPTMTETPGQENQKMIHGGNFVKNIMSYFTIMALVILLFSGAWRKHVLPIAVFCGYLVVLVFSSFAQSERFHLPILPLTLMFAALGISLMKENPWIKRYFSYWCVLMFLAAIAWNWFKLAGRGMI